MLKKSLLAAMFATSLGAIALPASAAVDVILQVAPPEPRYEVVPAPRRGYTWAPGYWGWDGNRHYWHPGQWMEHRHGHRWVPAHWVDTDPGPRRRWRFVPGHWERA